MEQKTPTGFIDLHCHILPGIDDGCVSVAESLAIVRRLQQSGYVGSVCTPHVWPDQFPHNVPEKIEGYVADLAERLQEEGIDYQLWAGGEVRINEETVAGFETHGIPTLGASRSVLIDYWGNKWPACGDHVVNYLLDHNYRPILAHPERMDFDENDWWALLQDLQQRGVWLQGNFNSFVGGEGRQAEQRMHRLLREEGYHLVATDTHHPHDLESRLLGLDRLKKHAGAGTISTMLAERPRKMLITGNEE